MSPTTVKLPFRYPGGKYYALKYLKPFWKVIDHDEYREPMVGGGAVFFGKENVQHNWINDLHEDLIITYKVMADPEMRKELIEMVSDETASKERHKEVKEMEPDDKLGRAFRFYYLNRTSFSGKMKDPYWGYRPKRSLPPERWEERIKPCGEKLENVKITNLDFEEVIRAEPKGEEVLMFIDPPYFESKQEDHYVCSFEKEDHYRLEKTLRNTPFKFFLTYDDVDKIKELYDWAYIYPVEFYYRLSNSNDSDGSREKGDELVITNYSIEDKKNQSTLLNFDDKVDAISKPDEKQFDKLDSESIRSPFRYPGSKARAVKYIKPFWKKYPHDEYREPFFGGGAVFFAKPKAKHNWINDIDKELMITCKVMADPEKREKLIEMVSDETASKDRFEEIKEWEPETDLEIAKRFYYINRTAYSGIMNMPNWGYSDKKSVPPSRWDERIREAGKKLEGVKITDFDYHNVINSSPKGKRVFLFVDPPYFKADQDRAYKHSFTEEDHRELCEVLKNTDYKFCLTYDDCEEVREMYQDWGVLHPRSWRYHTANANKADRRMGHELVITNF